jgi:hypothetical protein
MSGITDRLACAMTWTSFGWMPRTIDWLECPMSPQKELFDLTAEVRGETPRAIRLYDGSKTEWVPRSQVEDNGDGTFTMPLWLAKEKGFT